MVISFLSLLKIIGVQLKKWVCHAEVLNVFDGKSNFWTPRALAFFQKAGSCEF